MIFDGESLTSMPLPEGCNLEQVISNHSWSHRDLKLWPFDFKI